MGNYRTSMGVKVSNAVKFRTYVLRDDHKHAFRPLDVPVL